MLADDSSWSDISLRACGAGCREGLEECWGWTSRWRVERWPSLHGSEMTSILERPSVTLEATHNQPNRIEHPSCAMRAIGGMGNDVDQLVEQIATE